MISKRPKIVLIIGFIAITLLLISIVIIGLQRMLDIGNKLDDVVNIHSSHALQVQNMITIARERSLLLHKIALNEDPILIEEQIVQLYELGSEFMVARDQLASSDIDQDEQLLFNEQSQLSNIAIPLQYKVVNLAKQGEKEQALILLQNEAIPAQDNVLQILNQLVLLQSTHSQHALHEANESYRSAKKQILYFSILALIVGIFIITYVVNRINLLTRDLQRRKVQLVHANKSLENKLQELSNTQRELAKSELQERAIRENMLDAIVTIDDKGIMDTCNRAAEKMFGYSADEMIGNNVKMLMPDVYRMNHDEHVSRHMQGGPPKIIGIARDMEGQRKDGSTFPLDIGITHLELEGKKKVISILRDITERKQAENALRHSRDELEKQVELRTQELLEVNKRLQHMANYDDLTGLANRALFLEHLKIATAHARRNHQLVATLFLDLDGFKPVNDQYGHKMGDLLLKEVASILKDSIREEDSVGRVGGDEFVVVLGELSNKKYAAHVAEKLVTRLGKPILCDDKQIQIGSSIGISIFPEDSDDIEMIVQAADEAMYQAKNHGKNQYVFYSG